jgi:hypothetical protein
VVIRPAVALVIDLHQHVAVVALQQPVGGVGDGAAYRGFVLHLLVLREIEVADDGHHAQRVGLVEDAGEAIHVRGPQIPVRFNGAIDPRLALGVALGAAALQVDGESQQPVPPPLGSATTNSRVLRSGSHWPVSGYAHLPRVSGSRSSKIPCTARTFMSRPSIFRPRYERPAYVGLPLRKNCSPRIETTERRAGAARRSGAPERRRPSQVKGGGRGPGDGGQGD